VLAAGKRKQVLKSGILTEVFGEPVGLVKRNGRAVLLVEPAARRMMFKAGRKAV